ncbi:hypothetical protein SCLARK_001062 [Spiroplasma clarkii]|uniref:hypothetical protein n=1 Tax=Spiroplasma clarkii TaxID=2139 RepID=UPI000B574038|nr:hypothetical protein [Spiroplasma clarkii]ARU91642.1 hypothetical protein SCLARK_001062 [Spiroplasma clarkii]
MLWIFWAATYISKSAASLNFNQNVINIFNFLINTVGLGFVSTGVSRIHRGYTRGKKFYGEWLRNSKIAYDNLFQDLVIVNEVNFYNKKFDWNFTNEFVEFYGNDTECQVWNMFLLQKYQRVWKEYWTFVNSQIGEEFLAKKQNYRTIRVVNSFFANFLAMAAPQ